MKAITKITKIPLSKINDIDYNTNNVTNETSDNDYIETCRKFHATNYINNLYTNKLERDISVIVQLTPSEIAVLKQAACIGIYTLKISELYKEEIQQIIEKIETNLPKVQSKIIFVRNNECSPKDSPLWGACITAEEIVTLLISSMRIFRVLNRGVVDENILILKPWVYIDRSTEYRVFIYNGQITGISQYYLYEYFDRNILDFEKYFEKLVYKIQQLYYNFKHLYKTCVMDIYIHHDEEQTVQLIEFNPFGAKYSSGSALFNWVTDHEQLYGLTDGVEVRITSKN